MEAVGDEKTFEARMDGLPEAAAFVASFCERNAIDARDALRLALIVEELYTNVVQHGYGENATGPIRLALARDGRDVTLVCEDRARAFDPRPLLARMPEDLGAPLESRGVGGLGDWIVGRLADVAGYTCSNGTNRLTLRYRLGAGSR